MALTVDGRRDEAAVPGDFVVMGVAKCIMTKVIVTVSASWYNRI